MTPTNTSNPSGIDPAVERVKEDLAAELREIGNWFALYADESDRATTAFLAAARIERLEEALRAIRDLPDHSRMDSFENEGAMQDIARQALGDA